MSEDRLSSPPGNGPEEIEAEARKLIEEAKALLETLRTGRETVEARMHEQGRVDAMRHVRGNSSLDLAIDRTKSMIEALEELRRGTPVRDGG